MPTATAGHSIFADSTSSSWPSLSRCLTCASRRLLVSSRLSLHLLYLLKLRGLPNQKKTTTHERCNCNAASLSAMVEPDATFLWSSTVVSQPCLTRTAQSSCFITVDKIRFSKKCQATRCLFGQQLFAFSLLTNRFWFQKRS